MDFAVALLLASQELAATPATPFDRVILLALDASDAPLAEHGASEGVELAVDFGGTLHLWTRTAGELDLFLRVETPDGRLVVENDDSGGGTTPYVAIGARPGIELVVYVASSKEGGAGELELCAMAGPENEGTRAASEAALAGLEEVERLSTEGELELARGLATETLDALLAVDGGEESELTADALRSLGFATYGLSLLEPTEIAWDRVRRHRERTLPQSHFRLQQVRGDVAVARFAQGDIAGARTLEEQVLATYERTLPPDDPELSRARFSLGGTLYTLGDIEGARALFEQALEVYERTLPDDHREVCHARLNLATAIKAQGDLAGARALEEQVLEVYARTLPEEHPDLIGLRLNLAGTSYAQGDFRGARELFEQVLAVCERTLPEDHPEIVKVRLSLASTLHALGDYVEARARFEQVLAACERTLPADHPDSIKARRNLAGTMVAQGDFSDARPLFEQVLAAYARTLPEDHPDLQEARASLATAIALQAESDQEAREGAREQCVALVRDLCRSQSRRAREALLTSSAREAEERCAKLSESLGAAISFAVGLGIFGPIVELEREAFVLSEMTRGAALTCSAIARGAAGEADYERLREELRQAGDELAALAQRGTTSEEYHRARARREQAERELVALAGELLGDEVRRLDFDPEVLAARSSEREALVAFRRFPYSSIAPAARGDGSIELKPTDQLCAFVVRRADSGSTTDAGTRILSIVQLGPFDVVEQAVHAWRASIGAGDGSAGRLRGVGVGRAESDDASLRADELRRVFWDPVVPSLGDAERVTVVLDDVLHLVPLDALPLALASGAAGPPRLVGDRWRIETHVTVTELLGERPAIAAGGVLVALGGADFDAPPVAFDVEDHAALGASEPQQRDVAEILRGGAWDQGFSPLLHTGAEAREIAALRGELVAPASRVAIVLDERAASRVALEELAPRARYLHVATHGWFAPESLAAWGDATTRAAASGPGPSGEEQMRGMSPMLLCGLALAGANLSEDELGRAPGLVTAEELSTLDLRNCELAVLSACDTNVGPRRAGQGVASLQKALQMAGARSVITSLWKVPDEATKELMLDFYRRLWVEQKPKHQALWEAKQHLRDARDESGALLYTTRDWAAWVLTGDPD